MLLEAQFGPPVFSSRFPPYLGTMATTHGIAYTTTSIVPDNAGFNASDEFAHFHSSGAAAFNISTGLTLWDSADHTLSNSPPSHCPTLTPGGELLIYTALNFSDWSIKDRAQQDLILIVLNATDGTLQSSTVIATGSAPMLIAGPRPLLIAPSPTGWTVVLIGHNSQALVLALSSDGTSLSLLWERPESDSLPPWNLAVPEYPLFSADSATLYLINGQLPDNVTTADGTCTNKYTREPMTSYITARNATTGQELWRTPVDNSTVSNMVPTFDGAHILALKIEQHSVVWFEEGPTPACSPQDADESLFLDFNATNWMLASTLVKIDQSTGVVVLTKTASALSLPYTNPLFAVRTGGASPLAVGPGGSSGVVYALMVAKHEMVLVALDSTDLSLLWHTSVTPHGQDSLCGDSCDWATTAGMMLVGDSLLVNTGLDNTQPVLFSFKTSTGERLWHFNATSDPLFHLPLAPAPAPGSGLLFGRPTSNGNQTVLYFGCAYGGGNGNVPCRGVCPDGDLALVEAASGSTTGTQTVVSSYNHTCYTPPDSPIPSQSYPNGITMARKQNDPDAAGPMWLPAGGLQLNGQAVHSQLDPNSPPPFRWNWNSAASSAGDVKPGLLLIDSTAVDSDEHIFVATADSPELEIAPHCQVVCLDGDSGEVIWSKLLDDGSGLLPLNQRAFVAPMQLTQDEKYLVVGTGISSAATYTEQKRGTVFILDAKTGQILAQSLELTEKVQSVNLVYTDTGLRIVVQTGQWIGRVTPYADGYYETSFSSTVYCFDGALSIQWFELQNAAGPWAVSCDGSRIYNTWTAEDHTRTVARDITDGSLLWSWTPPSTIMCTTPAINCANDGADYIIQACQGGLWVQLLGATGAATTLTTTSKYRFPSNFQGPSIVLGGDKNSDGTYSFAGALSSDLNPEEFEPACVSSYSAGCPMIKYSMTGINLQAHGGGMKRTSWKDDPIHDAQASLMIQGINSPIGQPWIDNNNVAIYSEDDAIVARSTKTGKIVWKVEIQLGNDFIQSPPVYLGAIPLSGSAFLMTFPAETSGYINSLASTGQPPVLAKFGCPTGSYGPLCSMCETGYYYFRGCNKCPDVQGGMMFVTFAVFILVIILLVVLGSSPAAVPLTIGINFFQVLGILPTLGLKWNPNVNVAFSYLGLLNFSIDMAGPECSFPGFTYAAKFYSLTIGLSAAVLVLAILYNVLSRIPSVPSVYPSAAIRATLWLQYLGFLTVTQKCLELFDCTTWITGRSTLDSHPLIYCYESEWFAILPASIFGLLIFTFGTLAVTIWATQRVRLATTGGKIDNRFVKNYFLLFQRYKIESNDFEVTVLVRKAWMAAVSLIFSSYPMIIINSIITVGIFSFALSVYKRPFRFTQDTFLEICLQLLLVLITSLADFSREPEPQPGEQYEYEYTEEEKEQMSTAAVACVISTIFSLVITVVAILWRLYSSIRLKRMLKAQVRAAHEDEAKGGESTEQILPEKKKKMKVSKKLILDAKVEALLEEIRAAPKAKLIRNEEFASTGCCRICKSLPGEPRRVKIASRLIMPAHFVLSFLVIIFGSVTMAMPHEPGPYPADCQGPACSREQAEVVVPLAISIMLGSLLLIPPFAHLPGAMARHWVHSKHVRGFWQIRFLAWLIYMLAFFVGPALIVTMPVMNGTNETQSDIDAFFGFWTAWFIGTAFVAVYYMLDFVMTRRQLTRNYELYTETVEEAKESLAEAEQQELEVRVALAVEEAEDG